ncbi:transcriptional regulator GcvA [Usitatibacter palustris]|uniref:Glycine cleavage system transcriptional activator n=1 Tax=Usitatibacter palustris TaxID=2732487 RepID=A0A6M4H4X0_9PROT|nr:transcriptional regulator GcvA [Usitatibacter palustris]QJR13998.1 Glycine cleavage system transcriptional activator [Usitatibacter palustris]
MPKKPFPQTRPPARIPPLGSLRAFEAAARHLSFQKASEEIHVTASAVGQQVRTLEEYLGVALFKRLPRSLVLTAAGEAMLPKVREGFECFAAAIAALHKPTASGVLTLGAPPTFTSRWLMPRLHGFAAAHPEVELHVTTSVGMIDRNNEKVAADAVRLDPRDEDVITTIRYGAGRYPGSRVDRIFQGSYVPVCSPALLKGRRPLRQPEDLRYQTLIHDEGVADLVGRPAWSEWVQTEGVKGVDANRGPRFSDSALAIEGAIDGLGVALALWPLVRADVMAGRLVVPFEAPIPSGYAYYLVTPESEADRPEIVAFRSWLLAASTVETD